MKVLLGVTGGIAAYKAVELVRLLQNRGVDVQVAMTSAAEEFVRPLTFAALTGHPVLGSLWQPAYIGHERDFAIEHIAIAQQIDALVVAPCTANMLAKLAHGLADDLLSTVYLATRAPTFLAPAMNVNMWQHPATQANLILLRARGATIVDPDSGYLACGMTGGGRLADLETIADTVSDGVKKLVDAPSEIKLPVQAGVHDFSRETVLITAGGTREPVDAVRFLGNRSSGKMGHALAEAAIARGAQVILITASLLSAPSACRRIQVATAEEMLAAVRTHLSSSTMVLKAAAVADFRPSQIASGKLRRGGELTLHLEPTPDILVEIMATRAPGTFVLGFAAETPVVDRDLVANGRAKLHRKGVDALVVNDVSTPATGFDSEENAGFFLTPSSTTELSRAHKLQFAHQILGLALIAKQGTLSKASSS
jgi:phosphopantothenoylcysteine decarboxylase/phosphopantothenate--cysteine ligase